VAVEPDDNGRYDIPEGGTSGWYKTQAEAYVQCPAPPVALADCYPEAGYVVPGLITLSVVNVVNATSFMQRWPYSEASTVHPAGGGPFYYDTEAGCFQFGCGAVVSWPEGDYPRLFQVSSTPEGNYLAGIFVVMWIGPRPDGSGIDVSIQVVLSVNNTNTCGLGGLTFVGDNGFSDFDSLETAVGDFFCSVATCGDITTRFFPGTTLSFASPMRVGRVTGHSIGGAYDYYNGLQFDLYIQ